MLTMSVLALGAVLIVPVVRATDVIEPPRVKFPVLVTVPVKVKPLTVPVPPTEVTVPTLAEPPNDVATPFIVIEE